jgi:subtilisin family serine protease
MKAKKWVIGICIVVTIGIIVRWLPSAPYISRTEPNNQLPPAKSFTAYNSASRFIKLNYASFDPLYQLPALPSNIPLAPITTPDQENLYIVQFNSAILNFWRQQILNIGGEIYDYIPDNAYLVKLTGDEVSKVKAQPYVRWVGNYEPAYKLSRALLSKTGTSKFIVQAIADEPGSNLLSAVGFAGGKVENLSGGLGVNTGISNFRGYQSLVVDINANALPQLSAIKAVVWIEERPKFTFDNSNAAWVVQSKTGNNYSIWKSGINGAGPKPSSNGKIGTEQIIAVADSGIHLKHLDFSGSSFPNATIFGINNLGTQFGSPDDVGMDSNGHGTHVAGTIAGSGAASGGETPYNNGSHKGIAYGARLYVQQLGPDLDFLNFGPAQAVSQAMNDAYKKGARFQSNSWGAWANGSYTDYSRQADEFMWQNRDFLGVWANGNSGPQENSVGAPATAKNILSVGATNNGSNFDNLANFSSRGPTKDGRAKPDITAPGSCLISSITDTTNGYECYSGTSMATPVTTASAALIREWFQYTLGYSTPQASLIKAAVINSGDYMKSVGGSYPNNNQGWGRVYLESIVQPSGGAKFSFADNTTGLNTGESAQLTYTVTDSSQPLKITLAWTDAPGSLVANTQLVNNLDLIVTAPDGKTIYRGNNFNGQFSNTTNKTDKINNVEGVTVQKPATGKWTVKIQAANIPLGPQPYSLAVRGMLDCKSAANFISGGANNTVSNCHTNAHRNIRS